MSINEIPLFSIINDLIREPEVRQRFNRDPKKVIREYKLDVAANADQLEALLSMDKTTIGDKLSDLFRNQYQMIPGEFPPPNENFLAEDGGIDPMYPSPKPGTFRVRPWRVSATEVNAKPVKAFELVVYGQSFVQVDLRLRRISDSQVAKLSFAIPPFGTFRGSILRAVVSPPQGEAQFNANDNYHVVVLNLPGTTLESDVGPGAARPLVIAP
jgi:hypothetical protein